MTLAKTEEGADSQKRVTIFWSWQDDSPGPVNREFIQDCLQRAAKELGKVRAAIISLDRDTRGVAGSPEIAATILGKVRSSDVFVFDSTLYYSKPRASPNRNVMLELGYALAALGDSRVIGVM